MRPGHALRVLLVEDNELDARMMVRNLARHPEADFTVTRVGDLRSAIELLDRSDFTCDCVLLDLSLPDSSGLVSVELLIERFPDQPIVVLTGLDDPSTALQAVEEGAQDYLAKQSAGPETVARSIRYAVARLHAEAALRSATDQLTLLRDRERIARDLHDTVIQQLFATGMSLQAASATIDDPDTRQRVVDGVEQIDGAIRQLREAIFGLHEVPQGVALAAAVDALADEKVDALGFCPVVEIGAIPEDLAAEIRHETLQIISEGLSNVAKHAAATAATVRVEGVGEELVVVVTDNGRGIPAPLGGPDGDEDLLREVESRSLNGRGLVNMQERAAELEGRFHIGPGPGGGTRVEWRVPLGRQARRPPG